MPSIRKSCAECGKRTRFEKTNSNALCRPCYKAQYGKPRPIPSRKKAKHVNTKKRKAAPQPQSAPKKGGKR